MPNQDVIPTTDMETKVKVEEILSAEETRNCQPYKKVKSRRGQTNWTICRHADCYGCYSKKNAVVDFRTDDNKEETTKAIGGWTWSTFWNEANTRQKIECIAYFLATRPAQRGVLSKFGA
eukprot:13786104-Heterocapsa_arctica.AAC.1